MDVYNSETMVITPHTLYSWDWNFLTTRSYDYWWEHTPLTEVNTISSALSRFRTAVSKARGGTLLFVLFLSDILIFLYIIWKSYIVQVERSLYL